MLVYCTDNPVTETEDYRMEVLIRVQQLDTLDKESFSPEEKQDAQAAYEERLEELELEDAIPDKPVLRQTTCPHLNYFIVCGAALWVWWVAGHPQKFMLGCLTPRQLKGNIRPTGSKRCRNLPFKGSC